MSESEKVASLSDVSVLPKRAGLTSAEQARRGRRVSQAVSVAYHQARGLSELMTMIVKDVDALPVHEREAVRRANVLAFDAFTRLNSIIIDAGNVKERLD